jgi:hypothetical protein
MKSLLPLAAVATILLGFSAPALASDDRISGAVGVDAVGGVSGDSKAGDTLSAPSTTPVRN